MMECLNELLMHAIIQNDLKCLKCYLKRGVNINKICSTGMTLLGVAAETGNLSIVKTLIDYSNCSSIDFSIKTELNTKPNLLLDLNNPEPKYKNIGYFVVRKDVEEPDFGEGPTPEGMEALEWDMEVNTETTEVEKEPPEMNIYQWYANILNQSSLVLKSPDNDIARLDSHGKNVLHYAVRSGNMELVKYLVETFNEISVNQSDAASVSPLHIAVFKCHLPLVRYLVDKGASVNCACRERQTPLHVAAQHGYVEIMQVLIENEADINVFDMKERSPLSLAVLGSREAAVELLIKNGARLNQEDAAGFTPLRRAVWNDSTPIAMMLLNAGARVVQSHYLLHAAARSNNPEMVKALHEAGALLNIRDDQGNTPLMVACSRKNLTVARYLLKNGANVNAVNNINGMTALHICVQDIREKRSLENLIDLLVSYDADMNATSYQGSVLFYSIILENLHGADALVRHGVDVNLRDERAYFDNLSLAKRHGNLELVKLIVYAGFRLSNMAFDLNSLRNQPDDPVHDFLVYVKSTPLQLKEICRIKIRGCLGRHLLSKITKLPLPVWLQRYLALEIL
ncbi:ankyrin-1 [Tribolium castaneum]|uniref:Ankyrin-1-like Protein n=1 Tax=Tribolium castaneum TaxID=7070 RepID=D6WMU1_TRICA|nr:PREDICTED: ankyrin-1 [Tribolium castaneum]EFA03060.1 Ankyrin-1-like Protein [Tribolium castaneum]|eukprot:XP_967540.1 PREDICTED: ankyrin-1 [Tribolium castaneum]